MLVDLKALDSDGMMVGRWETQMVVKSAVWWVSK